MDAGEHARFRAFVADAPRQPDARRPVETSAPTSQAGRIGPPGKDKRVHSVVARVNHLLGARDDPWGVASWWISDHPRLGGACPRDLVGSGQEDTLIALASSDDD